MQYRTSNNLIQSFMKNTHSSSLFMITFENGMKTEEPRRFLASSYGKILHKQADRKVVLAFMVPNLVSTIDRGLHSETALGPVRGTRNG